MHLCVFACAFVRMCVWVYMLVYACMEVKGCSLQLSNLYIKARSLTEHRACFYGYPGSVARLGKPCHYFARAGIVGTPTRHLHRFWGFMANTLPREPSPQLLVRNCAHGFSFGILTFSFSRGCSGVMGTSFVDVNCHFCDTACS